MKLQFAHIAFAVFAMALPFFLSSSAHAANSPIYTGTFSSNAVGGYDTVSYFAGGKPVRGSSKFKTEYKGATWLFSNQENLDLFKANPEKYAPQYGGYCAYAVGEKNALVSSDPLAYTIDGGKLYLNYDKDIQNTWLQDKDAYINKANANWPGLVK